MVERKRRPRFIKPDKSRLISQDQDGPIFSGDFRALRHKCQGYTFSTTQAQCMEILWDVHEKGIPGISQEFLIEEIEYKGSRIRDIFKTKRNGQRCMHEAWGKIILVKDGLITLSFD